MISRSWQPPEGARCANCGERPPGPGGILCPPCKQAIEHRVYQPATYAAVAERTGTASTPPRAAG